MISSNVDISFVQNMGFKTQVIDEGLKVWVEHVEVLISPDADDEDQLVVRAYEDENDLYWAWCGLADLEDVFDEMLDEIGL